MIFYLINTVFFYKFLSPVAVNYVTYIIKLECVFFGIRMRKFKHNRTLFVFYFVLLLMALPTAAGADYSFLKTASVFGTTGNITQLADAKPGDQVRYSLNLTLSFFSYVFVWGTVTNTTAGAESLPLQFKFLKPGEYVLYWDSMVPLSASGQSTIDIVFLSIPGRFGSAFSTYTVTGAGPSPAYAGSMKCMGCHAGFTPDIVNTYTQSGHYFAMSKNQGQAPFYPVFAPGVPEPPPGSSWLDIAYVVGGFGWAANFVSRYTGLLLTGPAAQYNLANAMLGTPAEFVSYTPFSSQFKCAACHATGYSSSGYQDNLIVGSWSESRVGCEACHGPGSFHVNNPNGVQPPNDPAAACTGCHESGNLSVVEASQGLLQHMQQAEELKASPKSFMLCTTCHDPHASAHYDDQAAGTGIVQQCTGCHTGVTVGLGMQSLECIDCHMPYAVKVAAAISFTDSSNSVHHLGDMRSHIFKVNADAASPSDMFSNNGTQLAVDTAGKTAGLTLDFVCLGCHRTGGQAATSYTFEQVKALAPSVHSQ